MAAKQAGERGERPQLRQAVIEIRGTETEGGSGQCRRQLGRDQATGAAIIRRQPFGAAIVALRNSRGRQLARHVRIAVRERQVLRNQQQQRQQGISNVAVQSHGVNRGLV